MAEYRAGEFATIPNIPVMGQLSPHELSVFVYLCWRAGKDKSCFPSYTLIEKDTNVSKRTAIRAIQQLEDLGWIKRVPRTRSGGSSASNEYRIMQVTKSTKGSVTESPRGVRKDTGGSVRKDTPLTITSKNNNHMTTTNVVEPKAHGNEEINLIVKGFEEAFGIEQTRGERRAAQWLRSKGSIEQLTALFQATAKAQAVDQYCPRTPTLTKFYYKLPDLQDYFKRRQESQITEIPL